MTILNFPPTAGEATDGSFTYESNGVLYSWDGAKWIANSESAFDDKYVNIDGDTMTGDLTVPSLNGGQLAGFRNQLINGDFRIWQRGTGFTNGDSVYTADRWMCTAGPGSTVDRSTTTPAGFAWSASLNSTASGGFQQGIELTRSNDNDRFALNSEWTVSIYSTVDLTVTAPVFRFRTSVGVGADQVTAATAPNWVQISTTPSNGFHRYSSTFIVIGDAATAPGDKLTNLTVSITGGTAVGNCNWTGIQLEPGPVATPFEHRPIGTELALCQRYYQVYGTDITMTAGAPNVSTRLIEIPRSPVMRAAPTQNGTTDRGALTLSGNASVMKAQTTGSNADQLSRLLTYTADAEL